ncbi:MAG: hypothetical protein KatS3mg087_1041 [Patescibacteria group bacterium]|nr:MAG: hypothetical protein KatS3mg087_1041 [Patescibacteria group bacterium]
MSSGGQSSEKRSFTLSDLLIARPCNDQQQAQNWERLRELLHKLDHFFQIHQNAGENHWRLCLVNLDCIKAQRISFGEASDLDSNSYKINYEASSEPSLKVESASNIDYFSLPVSMALEDDRLDYIVVHDSGPPPPPPPPPPSFPEVYLSNLQDDLYILSLAPIIDFDSEYDITVASGTTGGGYCECTNCCLYQWDEVFMMWNLIDPNGCELNPPNPPPGGSCVCNPPAGAGAFDGEQRYGTCSQL